MKAEIEKSISLCIEALNGIVGNATTVLDTMHKVIKQPYAGRGLGLGNFGHREYRTSPESMFLRFDGNKKIDSRLDWKSAILFLYDSINLSEEEILASAQNIQDDIIFNHIIDHIVCNFIRQNDVAAAVTYISHYRKTKIFKEEDNFDRGYLLISDHYATAGDVENFFKYFKLCEPKKNQYTLSCHKACLVEIFASKNEIKASIELCNHKSIGKKYYFNALYAFAKQGKYDEVKDFFASYPELKQPEKETELKILSSAYMYAKENDETIDDDFEELFQRALLVDRKLRWGDVKLQDSVLLDLGLSQSDNPERAIRCRKAIKDNRLKQELVINPKA